MKVQYLKGALISAAVVSLVACVGTRVEKKGEPLAQEIKSDVQRIEAQTRNVKRALVSRDNGIRLNGGVFKIREEPKLPSIFDQTFALGYGEPTEFFDVVTDLSDQMGFPIEFTNDAMSSISSFTRNGDDEGSDGGFDSNPDDGPDLGSMGFDVLPRAELYITLEKMDKAKSLFDSLASRAQISWSWEGDHVLFYKYRTRTFVVDTLPGSPEFSGSLSSSVSTSGEDSSTASNYSTSINFKSPEIWEVIVDKIESVKSPGGRIVANPQSASITVTDTPEVLRRVDDVISDENERLSKSVFMTVDLIEFLENDSDEYGLDFENLIYSGSKDFGFSLKSGTNGITDAAATLQGAIINPTSNWSGSNAFLRAVSSVGKNVSHRRGYIHTTNGVPAPWQEIREITYLAKQSSTAVDGSVETSLEPGVTTEGFTVHATPMVLSTGDLMLQMGIDMSVVEEITRQGPDDNFIQAPIRVTKNALPRVVVKGGESVIAYYLKRDVYQNDRSGIGSPKSMLAGGSIKSSAIKSYTVAIVTPYYQTR